MTSVDLSSLLGGQQNPNPYGVIPEQPDINTAELATYGQTYLDVKSVLYLIDMMQETAQREYEKVIASCHGEEYRIVKRMLTRSPFIVTQNKPHVESLEELNAARKAKRIYRAASTVRTIEKWRVEVEAYGAMHGAYEYGQTMMESGVSAEMMKRVFKKRASKGMTNSYASVRDMREGRLMDGLTDEERSLTRMAEMILMANEYDRMEREYPEDDSGDRLLEVWQEQVERARKAANPQAASEPDDDAEEGSEPEFRMDMSVLNNVPRHVGLDFVTEDDDEDQPENTEEDSDEDDVPKTPEEPHVGIGPVASSPEDAVDAVPPVEKVRLGPGAPDEVRFFLDSKYGRIERIGPVSSSALDAVDCVDDVLATFMPPSHPDEFAKWYGRHLQSEHPTWGRVEGYDDGDDGIVLVARPREDVDGTDGSDVDRNEKGVDARACDHGSGNTHENDDVHCENKDVDARPREGDTEEGA